MGPETMRDIEVSTMNITLPGHGDVPLASDYNLPNLSNYLVDKIGEKEVIIIGSSIGGMLAHQIADRINLKALISIGIPPLSYDVLEGAVLENECTSLAYNPDLSEDQMMRLAEVITDVPKGRQVIFDAIKMTDPKTRSGLMSSIGAGEMRNEREILAALEIPMLFIKCSKDNVINNEKFDNLGFGEVIEMEGGHILPIEAPKELNKVINDFLSKNQLLS